MRYMDNSDSRPIWRTMCSRLNEGICEKRLTLRDGEHSLNIQALDDAGNSVNSGLILVV